MNINEIKVGDIVALKRSENCSWKALVLKVTSKRVKVKTYFTCDEDINNPNTCINNNNSRRGYYDPKKILTWSHND